MLEGQVVIFELSGVRYCIDILQVQEIMRMVEVTPVAESDAAIEGLINLRGEVIPVINLSRRLSLLEREKDEKTRVIVVEQEAKKIGLIVDRVLEVGTYTAEEMAYPSHVGTDVTFIKGIIKKKDHLLLLLNMAEVA